MSEERGFALRLFTPVLQAILNTYHEVSSVNGASVLQTARFVTLPHWRSLIRLLNIRLV